MCQQYNSLNNISISPGYQRVVSKLVEYKAKLCSAAKSLNELIKEYSIEQELDLDAYYGVSPINRGRKKHDHRYSGSMEMIKYSTERLIFFSDCLLRGLIKYGLSQHDYYIDKYKKSPPKIITYSTPEEWKEYVPKLGTANVWYNKL